MGRVKFNLKGPRAAQVMEILQGATDGLRSQGVAEQLGSTLKQARSLLVAMKAASMISLVGSGVSARWCLHGMAKRIEAEMLAARIITRRVLQRAVYHRRIADGTINRATGRTIFAPDMPVVQRVVSTWTPTARVPGPPSVFHLGGTL